MEPEPAQREDTTSPRPPRRRPRRGGRRAALVAAQVVLLAVAFFVGLFVGRALEDAPAPGGEQTIVRTLVPETIGPAESTVTVTVTEPTP